MILEKIKVTIKNINFAIKSIWQIGKSYIFLTFFSAVLTSAYRIFMTLVVSEIINQIQLGNGYKFFSTILTLAGISIGVILINAVTFNYIMPVLNNRISKVVQTRIYNKYLNTSLEKLLNKEYYDLYYFVLNNGERSMSGLVGIFGQLLSNIISVIGISALFLQYDYYIIGVVVIGVFISFIYSTIKVRKKHQLTLEMVPENRKIDYVNRVFYQPEYSKEVRAGNIRIFFDLYNQAFINIRDIIKARSKELISLDFITNLSMSFSTLIALSLLGMKTIKGDLTLSTFAMLYTGVQQITNELNTFFQNFPSMYALSLNVEKYHYFMNEYKENQDEKDIDNITSIKLNNVSFSYANKNIIDGLDLIIDNKKRKIAIVGENGSGKSTLINLILGLYRPQNGQVLINDININNLNKRILRGRFSIVFQDFKIYSMSIATNILMKSNYDNHEKDIIIDALKMVDLYGKVSTLPLGIDSIISNEFADGGIGFSTGELQKIALARSYVSDSDILILDEPYSFSDVYSKADMNSVLDNISQNKIVIMITHDVTNLDAMDMIYVLERGKVVEQGTQHKLLDLKGKYFTMYNIGNKKNVGRTG